MKKLIVLFALALPLTACRSDKGNICNDESDCGGSLICASDVACGSPDGCQGICSDPCDTDEDCGSEERCIPDFDSDQNYCRFDELTD
ncbi:MAG: hypothetical protein AAGE52_33360 [Myxococcota bacterium]